MQRAAHLPPGASPALFALKLSLIPTLNLVPPSTIRKFSSFPSIHAFLPKKFLPSSSCPLSLSLKRFPPVMTQPCPRGKALGFFDFSLFHTGGFSFPYYFSLGCWEIQCQRKENEGKLRDFVFF